MGRCDLTENHCGCFACVAMYKYTLFHNFTYGRIESVQTNKNNDDTQQHSVCTKASKLQLNFSNFHSHEAYNVAMIPWVTIRSAIVSLRTSSYLSALGGTGERRVQRVDLHHDVVIGVLLGKYTIQSRPSTSVRAEPHNVSRRRPRDQPTDDIPDGFRRLPTDPSHVIIAGARPGRMISLVRRELDRAMPVWYDYDRAYLNERRTSAQLVSRLCFRCT